MAKPIVAIVGRPNVGKSTLFNKLIGQRISIVEDIPGVTRDRIYFETSWDSRDFILIDTGGIEPESEDAMLVHMRNQAELAIESADVIVFMVDLRVGVVGADKDVTVMLLKSRKPVILCVNKADTVGVPPPEFYEFYELGFDEPIPVSSIHGHGTADLLDRIVSLLPDKSEDDETDSSIKVAVIGKPNAGKSSLVNFILGENRMIVSDIPGTTRDAVDSHIENEFGSFTFIDTAGIRRQSRVDDPIEKYSVLRAHMAVDRADVCIILVDASEGVTAQDERIAGIAHEAGKGCIIAVNKWDLIDKDNKTFDEHTKQVRTALAYMSYAPLLFISAATGQRVSKIFEMIKSVNEQNSKRITTGMLNDVLNDATMRVQPPSDKGRRLKVYYMTQVSTRPPTFVIFCNDVGLFHYSYQRYIENNLREVFGFGGTPIRLILRNRGED